MNFLYVISLFDWTQALMSPMLEFCVNHYWNSTTLHMINQTSNRHDFTISMIEYISNELISFASDFRFLPNLQSIERLSKLRVFDKYLEDLAKNFRFTGSYILQFITRQFFGPNEAKNKILNFRHKLPHLLCVHVKTGTFQTHSKSVPFFYTHKWM